MAVSKLLCEWLDTTGYLAPSTPWEMKNGLPVLDPEPEDPDNEADDSYDEPDE